MMPRLLGCRPSPHDEHDAAYHAATLALPPAPVLPVAVPHLPPGVPWDQGQTGTCCANASLLAIEVAHYARHGVWLARSEADAERMAQRLYLDATGDSSLEQGTDYRTVLACALTRGVVLANGTRQRIGSYHTLLPSPDLVAAMVSAIAGGHVVLLGMDWPEDWMDALNLVTLPDPPQDEPIAGGHAIGAIHVAMHHPALNVSVLRRDALIENSWDLEFGVDGHAYLDASGASSPALRLVFDAWIVQAL